MLTIFTTPKPFSGEIARLQRNAIFSWTRLTPRPDIIVFGDESGASGLCSDLGVRHLSDVDRNEFGTPLIDGMLHSARANSQAEVLCYINADIILGDDFMRATTAAASLQEEFLMVGQRRTVPIGWEIDSQEDWRTVVRDAALDHGTLDNPYFIDYLAFSRSMFRELPPFAIGRAAFDNWLIWKALADGVMVLDATEAVLAVHQLHGYGHVQGGKEAVYEGVEAQRNLSFAGSGQHLRSIADATHQLTADLAIQRAVGGKYADSRRERRRARVRSNALFQASQPLRNTLGLRRSSWDALVRRWERLRR